MRGRTALVAVLTAGLIWASAVQASSSFLSSPTGLRITATPLNPDGNPPKGKGCRKGGAYYYYYCAENAVRVDITLTENTAYRSIPAFLGRFFAANSTVENFFNYYGYYYYDRGYYYGYTYDSGFMRGVPGMGEFINGGDRPAIDWGDGDTVGVIGLVRSNPPRKGGGNLYQGTFFHSYDNPGTYNVRIFAGGAPASMTSSPNYGQLVSGPWSYIARYGYASYVKGGFGVTNSTTIAGNGPLGIQNNQIVTAGIPPANVPATGLISKILLGLVLMLTGAFVLMRR